MNDKVYSFVAELPARLDKFLSENCEILSREQLKKNILKNAVSINGQISNDPSYKLKPGDEVIFTFTPEPEKQTLTGKDFPLNILYEDDYLIVINKPAGISMHPGAGVQQNTIAEAVLAHTSGATAYIGSELRPGIVHRLDKETSGVIVMAKEERTYLKLAELFETHTLERVYMALTWGSFSPKIGTIETNIGRSKTNRQKMTVLESGGKIAITHYKEEETFGPISLLNFQLKTGRTHQIRVHSKHLRHPIVGDHVYSNHKALAMQIKNDALRSELLSLKRQMLHAKKLAFTHPITGEPLSFESDPPADFANLLSALREEFS